MKPATKKKSGTKVVKSKKYELRALGYCCEITAHKLSAAEMKVVKEFCEGEDIEKDGDMPNMEDVLSSYDMYNTNMWQTSVVPSIGACVFGLYDSNNKEIFLCEDIERYQDLGTENFSTGHKGNVLVAFEEFKGVSSVWVLDSPEVPKPEDFKFLVGDVSLGKDDNYFFVQGVLFKGQELDKDYDAEYVVGKAFYSRLY